jgi:pimeloyl-ACP methyl ester carboxylesterase
MSHLNYDNIVAVIPDRIEDRPLSRTVLPYLEPTSAFALVDGMQVHFTRSGAGPTIVLLHGSGSSLHSFDEVARRLEDCFDVVRLDLPGCGLTGPRPDRDYRIETYVLLLDRFLAEHVRAPFLLAGHSLGGQIAWRYALDHPDRLLGLVLMNATGYPEKSLPSAFRLARNPLLRPILRRWGSRAATARSLAAVVGPGSDVVDDALVERVHTLMSRPGNRSAFVDLANTKQADRSADITRIRTPTLVMCSDLVDGQHFARDIAGSREVVLAGVGHLMPVEAPEAVAGTILQFAADTRALAT